MSNFKKIVLIILISLITMVFCILIGSTKISYYRIFENTIFTHIRIPRVLLAFCVGACLSVSGLVMQTLLKNPLVSPYTLGTSSGAGLGAAIIIVFDISLLPNITVAISAFIGALLTSVFVINFSYRVDKNLSTETIVLMGMILSLFLSSIISLFLVISEESARAIIMFMSGSLSLRGWNSVYTILPILIISSSYLFFRSKQLDILSFGEEDAHSIGVNVKTMKLEIIIITSILTGISVSVCGIIGFVGLVVPHLTRKIIGPTHRYSIIGSIFIGGTFLMISDLIARVIIRPAELPVGVITALFGAPFFAILYFVRRTK